MAHIKEITRMYTRHYRDNGKFVACVEWVDDRGSAGRTEGELGTHMQALISRGERAGLTLGHEVWG